ncbi:Bug family tripartite tricarboxylate transporter substrate binding protein [Spiribacter halobius]|uniref:Transporter n=1 Tax=Sediminicurvatus halobius TaxID=2182432 RepID=A0A2U2N9A2_9GAMM|nr:tripartite tricarboxylate transporter substrate-binding protein [Spiribacter halobius]PWG65741.1 transporter [Spiribacter halobius]UEX77777.1 hypothetical protein LMH63_17900 [Spiribacter halobius]
MRMVQLIGLMLLVPGLPGIGPAQACSADAWPCAPIQVVSHASAGGGTDLTIREWLPAAEAAGAELEVVYRQGGGARAAHEYLASRGTDGHTVLALTETHLYTIARDQSPFADIGELQGVARAVQDPQVILVDAGSGPADYAGLIDAGRREPILWGVAQIGGTEHVGIRRWAALAGVETRAIPFGGGGDMVAALRAGAVDAILANLSEARPVLAKGTARALAVLQRERPTTLADVPTSYELGHPVTVATTRGYAVLADTPDPLVARLEQLLLRALRGPRFQTYLYGLGLDARRQVLGAERWQRQLESAYEQARSELSGLDAGPRRE